MCSATSSIHITHYTHHMVSSRSIYFTICNFHFHWLKMFHWRENTISVRSMNVILDIITHNTHIHEKRLSVDEICLSLEQIIHICLILRNFMSNFPWFISIYSQRKEYVKYSKVFPLSDLFDVKIPSKWYRRVVGGLEVACGLAMALIPNRKFQTKKVCI